MLFHLFLLVAIIFTLFFFYTDVMNKINTNKSFAEGFETQSPKMNVKLNNGVFDLTWDGIWKNGSPGVDGGEGVVFNTPHSSNIRTQKNCRNTTCSGFCGQTLKWWNGSMGDTVGEYPNINPIPVAALYEWNDTTKRYETRLYNPKAKTTAELYIDQHVTINETDQPFVYTFTDQNGKVGSLKSQWEQIKLDDGGIYTSNFSQDPDLNNQLFEPVTEGGISKLKHMDANKMLKDTYTWVSEYRNPVSGPNLGNRCRDLYESNDKSIIIEKTRDGIYNMKWYYYSRRRFKKGTLTVSTPPPPPTPTPTPPTPTPTPTPTATTPPPTPTPTATTPAPPPPTTTSTPTPTQVPSSPEEPVEDTEGGPPPSETSLNSASNGSTNYLEQNTSVPQVSTEQQQIQQTPTYQQAVNQISGKNSNYQMANGNLITDPTGNCPNGCRAPQYDNEKCSNQMLGGKAYRNCPWIGDGSINDSMCKDCGSVLLPKNQYGYARTRAGLFNNNTLHNLLVTKKFNKEPNNPNINYTKIGIDFMNELSMARNFTLPFISSEKYSSVGKIVNKYQLNENTNSTDKKELTDVINSVLNSSKLPSTLKTNTDQYNLQKTLNEANTRKDTGRTEKIIQGLMGSNEFYKTSASGLGEMQKDNRLGGSKTLFSGYTTKYRPRDPRKSPNPYDSIWEVFK